MSLRVTLVLHLKPTARKQLPRAARAGGQAPFSLRDELPPATVEALLHRLLLGIETQAGAALSVCADAVVGNELSVVRWHPPYRFLGIPGVGFPHGLR